MTFFLFIRVEPRAVQAGVDTNLKMAHVTKEGYGAIPDYKDIAEQSKKVSAIQVSTRVLTRCVYAST